MNHVLLFILYVSAFAGLWYGSGLIITAVKILAQKIRIPAFAFSFFVLGMMTSIPEMAVGINALGAGYPEVFVGNLLGGIIVMFLLVIPLLAVINKKIQVKKHLSDSKLLITLIIIALPAFFTLDQVVTNTEATILVALYAVLFFIIRTKENIFARMQHIIHSGQHIHMLRVLLRLVIGVGLVYLTSQYIVEQTIAFSEFWNISTFVISLVVLGVGTNLPEISLALRSFKHKAQDIALGDYLGSAATNTMLFGVFSLFNDGHVVTEKSFVITFFIIIFALGMFFAMIRHNRSLSRANGLALLACYMIFLAYEYTNL